MDTFAHAGWGALIIRKTPLVWWAALSGALPDLLSLAYGFYKHKFHYFKDLQLLSQKGTSTDPYFKVYYFTHSLLPISLVAVVLAWLAPHYLILVVPYYLHIFLDIFTHRGIWATRIFYPISDFHFNFVDWWPHPWITVTNWTVFFAVCLIIYIT